MPRSATSSLARRSCSAASFATTGASAVHCRDGFEALAALLPPREKRGLVLIDPPYEEQLADLERVADALAGTAARWPQGVLAAWYPIKTAAVIARFHKRLLQTRAPARVCSGTLHPPRRLPRRSEWRRCPAGQSAMEGRPAICGRHCPPCTPLSRSTAPDAGGRTGWQGNEKGGGRSPGLPP